MRPDTHRILFHWAQINFVLPLAVTFCLHAINWSFEAVLNIAILCVMFMCLFNLMLLEQAASNRRLWWLITVNGVLNLVAFPFVGTLSAIIALAETSLLLRVIELYVRKAVALVS